MIDEQSLKSRLLMAFDELQEKISPADEDARQEAVRRWDAVAKPLKSLGILEEIIAQMAAIFKTADVNIQKSAVIVMCADNGVVNEGVCQTGQDVTAVVTENMTKRNSSVCAMASVAGADVIPVDVGVSRPLSDGVINRCVRRGGTRDMVLGAAMTKQECIQAIMAGAEIVSECKEKGYNLLATGEMGIGNTTTSSAVASVLLDKDVSEVTGRGAGLSSDGLKRKIEVITRALEINKPNPNDPIDVLSKVGGLDIAGLVGVFLGGASNHMPVLIDGFISSVAALLAVKISPYARDYQIASHVSKEPASRMVLSELGLKPFIHAEMFLGEGTGAVAAIPLLNMALAVYKGMPTFRETNIKSYVPLE